MRVNWNKIFAFTSWVIVAALLYAAMGVITTPPSGAGPIAQLLGIVGAQVFYGTLYIVEALLLAYAKWKRKNKMRIAVLMAIYLTGFFTLSLTLAIFGPTWAIIDNLVISCAAAVCWLWWRFKTVNYVPYGGARHAKTR